MIHVGAIIDDKYEVTGFLGGGGMGIVVEARHLELDTLVAIKFMRSDMLATAGGVARFFREARALVKLKSQHVVKVHDLGIHARMPFIVMEHLEGTDMQTLLDQNRRLDAADVARHIRQACEAIAEAHSMGIYHRDLKPANIFLSRGASGRTIVKVLDFGIAKMLQTHASTAHESLTGAWTMMGTPSYMSPEQLVSSKDIDGRADIWSLGVVMYELVTGKLPFDDENQLLLQRRIRFEAPRANTLPPALAPIIHRCLEKKREDRYQTIVELALALRPLMNESLSPFGSSRTPKNTPRALPDKPQRELAIAEGIMPRSASTESTTIPLRRLPRPTQRGATRCADSELPYARTARPPREESSAAISSDVLRPANEQQGEDLEDQVIFFNAGPVANQAKRRELAIAPVDREPTTVRQSPRQIGYGGTLIMESGPSNAPAVRQSVEPMPENETQTLVSPGCERTPSAAEVFLSIPRQSNAGLKRQHPMAIALVMAVAALIAFVIVFQWYA